MANKLTVLVEASKVRERIKEMGKEISDFYQGQPFTLIALVNGATFFAVDLARSIKGDFIFDTMAVASYSGQNSSGQIKFRGDSKLPVKDQNILLVDGVLDTGLTLSVLKDVMAARGAKSVRTAVLVSKNVQRNPKVGDLRADWVGFDLPNLFLVGMGMDDNERNREFEDICAVTKE